jgi:hypothetical protein
MKLAEATKRSEGLPTPPIPATLREEGAYGAEKAAPLKPEDFRARQQVSAIIAMDVLEWHARNLADAKSSIAASEYLMEIAGYGPPAKAKAGELPSGFGAGEAIPSVEDDVRKMGAAFAQMPAAEE